MSRNLGVSVGPGSAIPGEYYLLNEERLGNYLLNEEKYVICANLMELYQP